MKIGNLKGELPSALADATGWILYSFAERKGDKCVVAFRMVRPCPRIVVFRAIKLPASLSSLGSCLL